MFLVSSQDAGKTLAQPNMPPAGSRICHRGWQGDFCI